MAMRIIPREADVMKRRSGGTPRWLKARLARMVGTTTTSCGMKRRMRGLMRTSYLQFRAQSVSSNGQPYRARHFKQNELPNVQQLDGSAPDYRRRRMAGENTLAPQSPPHRSPMRRRRGARVTYRGEPRATLTASVGKSTSSCCPSARLGLAGSAKLLRYQRFTRGAEALNIATQRKQTPLLQIPDAVLLQSQFLGDSFAILSFPRPDSEAQAQHPLLDLR
jgi:hypothetical protein